MTNASASQSALGRSTESRRPPFKKVWVCSYLESRSISSILVAMIGICCQREVTMALQPRLINDRVQSEIDKYASFVTTVEADQLANWLPDLVVVIGGDGGILSASAWAHQLQIPILGINLGKLGFLVDVKPKDISVLSAILAGQYVEESRLMLRCVDDDGQLIAQPLNEVGIVRGQNLKMLTFDILVDHQLVCQQRSDGLIIATPTGSTAYAMSAGGPILSPSLEAVTMVPLCPHRLSSRPIVIPADSQITIYVYPQCREEARINCDGRIDCPFPGKRIHVSADQQRLSVIHPQTYQFFDVLRTKLKWENSPHADQCHY